MSLSQALKLAILLSLTGSASALADSVQFAASWSAGNSSFLSDYYRRSRSSEAKFLANLFMDQRWEAQLKTEYNHIVKAAERREVSNMRSIETQAARADAMRDFARKVFNETRSRHVNAESRKLRSVLDESDTLSDVRRPVEVAAGLAAIYQGEELKLTVAEKTRLSFQMNTSEKYRLGVTRGLPVWDLASGLSYGSTSNTMSASLSKQLTSNIRAEVATARNVGAGQGSGAMNVYYDIRF